MRHSQSNKIRIAVLENGLISTYTAREALMRQLVAHNFEVYVLTHVNQYCEKAREMGVQVINIGSANFNPFKISGYLFQMQAYLRKIQPDVCLTFSVRPAIWGNLISRLLNIPVITNITGTGPLFTSDSYTYKLIRKIYPFALRNTEKVFFQNSDDQNHFTRNGFVSAAKCQLIPGSGVDYRKFHPLDVDKSNKLFTFLYIGRLLKDKGVPEFIEAARIIRDRYPNVRFKIIGPLWKQNLKSNMISPTTVDGWVKEGTIEYLGEKTDVRIDIAQADCIVLPSHREGISNVLLEASSMERPCIATDVPGCREIIEHGKTGFLCKLKNPDDLALQMSKMMSLATEVREEMGKLAREKIIREFDKQIVLKRYFEEIDEILLKKHYPVYSLHQFPGKAYQSVQFPKAV